MFWSRKKHDYSDLEKEIRRIAPADKYGYLSYLLSPDYPIKVEDESELVFDGPLDYKIGYNCFDVSLLVLEKLRQSQKKSYLWLVQDEKDLFYNGKHVACVDDQGVFVDGTPLFDFNGAKHQKLTKIDDDKISYSFLSLCNPLTILNDKNNNPKYFLTIHNSEKPSKNTLSYVISLSNFQTQQYILWNVNIDLNKYRELESNSRYRGYSDKKTALEHFQKIKSSRIYVTEHKSNSISHPNFEQEKNQMQILLGKYSFIQDAFIHKVAYRR